jgi:hypothetical protein
MAEKYEKKVEKMTPYQLKKILTPYRYDPYDSSSDDSISVSSIDDKLVFSQVNNSFFKLMSTFSFSSIRIVLLIYKFFMK